MRMVELDMWLRDQMNIDAMASVDNSLNGIQVERKNPEVSCVAFAVDACMETFQRAVEQKADVLFVHHGLFWGKESTITGTHYERIRFLIEHDLALYAAHLPLDMNPEFGNNAGMAAALELEQIRPFGWYKGHQIGFAGRLPSPQSMEQICTTLFGGTEAPLSMLPFGPREIQSVGLVSGGAPYEVGQAIDEGLDCYITGDAQHTVYHRALEEKINVIFGGHYLTETWGVRLLSIRLADATGVRTTFIDVPTGL